MLYDADRHAIHRATPSISAKALRDFAAAATRLLLAGLCLDYAAALSGQDGSKQMILSDDSAAIQAAAQSISRLVDASRLADSGDFLEIQDFRALPNGSRVEQNSLYWSEKFFTTAANPYHQVGRKMSVHHATPETFDVLRHEYDAVGQHLLVDETANLILITVDRPLDDFLTKNEREKQSEILRIAGLLLKMSGTMVAPNLQDAPYVWVFRFLSEIREGSSFSTNPEVDPTRMWSWASRLDGGIYMNRLYFLAFKQRESTSGKIISPDGQHWFDGKT
jgi:hypothetical protein